MSQSSNHLRLVSWTWQWVHFTQMASTVTRSQSNRAPLGCSGTRDSHHGQICSNCVMLSCQWLKSLRNVSNTLLNLCHEKLRQKGVQPGTSKVYKIKLPVSVCVCIYIYIYIYIYIHTEQNYKYILCFCPHFSCAELKDLRLFLCTQKAYFSQIVFTNLSKSVLVSTSPLPR